MIKKVSKTFVFFLALIESNFAKKEILRYPRVGKVPLSQNRASEIKFVGPLSSIGAPELSSGAPFLTQGHACS